MVTADERLLYFVRTMFPSTNRIEPRVYMLFVCFLAPVLVACDAGDDDPW